MPLAVGGRKQFTCVVKPVRQVREPSKGYEMKDSFHMQETVNWSSKLTFSRERWSGIAPCYVRRVESAVQESRQTLVLGVDAQENPGGPLRPDLSLSLLPGPLPHDLCYG